MAADFVQTNDRRAVFGWLLVALSIPLFVCIAWYSRFHFYPRSDAGDYFMKTQAYYETYRAHGLWSALRQAYTYREKPILHVALGLFFLIAAHGKVIPTIELMMLSFFAILLLYVFLSLRLGLGNARAALGCVFVGAIPWVIASSHHYMAELPLLAWGAAFAYHYIRSEFGADFRHSLLMGLALGFSLCTRPAEALGVSLVPMIIWVILALRSGWVTNLDLALSLPVLVASISILPRDHNDIRYAGLALLAFVPWGLKRIRRGSESATAASFSYAGAYALSAGVALAWLAPLSGNLFRWVYGDSFGSEARSTRVGAHGSAFGFIAKIIGNLGGEWMFLWAILAAIGLIGFQRVKLSRRGWALFFAGFGAITLPLVVGSAVYNPSLRYYYLPILVMDLGFFALALRRDAFLPTIRGGLAVIATCAGVIYFATPFFTVRGNRWWMKDIRPWELNVRPEGMDPALTVMNWLLPLIRKKKEPGSSLLKIAVFQRPWPSNYAIDPWALQMIAREGGENLRISWPFDMDNALSDTLSNYRQYYQYALIGPVESGGISVLDDSLERDRAQVRFADQVIKAWKRGRVSTQGVKLVSVKHFSGAPASGYTLLLVRFERRRAG